MRPMYSALKKRQRDEEALSRDETVPGQGFL